MAQLKAIVQLVALVAFMACTSTIGSNTPWATTSKAPNGNKCQTVLQFYLHDIMSPGPYQSALKIAESANTSTSPFAFGLLVMSDDPLTTGPEQESEVVGRGQGLWGFNGREEPSLIMDMSFTFKTGIYIGSSVTLVGNNPAAQAVNREVAVAGGTGLFRMSLGYALLSTYSFDGQAGNAVIFYNITLFHSCPPAY